MSDNSKPADPALGKLPPKPKEPDAYECCGRGCDPCVYDYYAKALTRWEKKVAEFEQQENAQVLKQSDQLIND